VGDLPDVDLLGELADHRLLDVLRGPEASARHGPAAGVGGHGPLPQQGGERAVADGQHGGQHLVLGRVLSHAVILFGSRV
jgi:hypothetical protein